MNTSTGIAPFCSDTIKQALHVVSRRTLDSPHGLANSESKFLATSLAKEASLVMMYTANRGEPVGGTRAAPFAKVTFRRPFNRDGLIKLKSMK
jgi:hypothetical protein